MQNSSQVKNLYQIAVERIGTPYELFGKHMLNIISVIEEDKDLEDLEFGTAMWTLLLKVPDISESIHVSWDEDTNEYVVYRTFEKTKCQSSDVEGTLACIKDILRQLTSDTS